MPSGEDVEMAVTADFLAFLAALFGALFPATLFLAAFFLVALRALTFLLFFTRLPSLFENLGGLRIAGEIQVIHFPRFPGLRRSTRCEPIDRPAFLR